jgi:glycine hydroxymethyltransferase
MSGGSMLAEFAAHGVAALSRNDPELYELLEQEYRRQTGVLAMIAASSVADSSVLACEGTVAGNVTTEGYPSARFHAGCRYVDEIERLAVERAKHAFGAQYANVQPHSGSSANEIVMFSLLRPGDTVLGLELSAGGHLTHGAKASVSGQYFKAVGYRLGPDDVIDYEQVARTARECRPRLIICGASSYPRVIDFASFREIADEVGALLLADISHIAGLVAAGVHPSPIDHAHFTTTSTYKQLYGPRGGVILIGKEHQTLAPDGKRKLSELVQRAVFPFFQGTPHLGAIAAKARAFAMVGTPEFKKLARMIVSDAKVLADSLMGLGYRLLTNGTDNHIVLVDVLARGITGVVAERALEECDIIVNKNRIPNDVKSAYVTSGMRLGTNSLALRGMGREEMRRCASLIDEVLDGVEVSGDFDYRLDPVTRAAARAEVAHLCTRFPIPHYPLKYGEETPVEAYA